MENKFGPCIEKKCSICCNPVKVARNFPDDKIPIDEIGNRIWRERKEFLVPEKDIDAVSLKTFECSKFDMNSGKCLNYEKRPDICKNTSCIVDSSGDIDKQHKDFVEENFVKITTK